MKCRICDNGTVEGLYTIPNYPIVGGPVAAKGAGKVKTGNVTLGLCNKCGTCILIEPKPDEVRYDDAYTSSNGAVSLGAQIDDKMSRFLDLISNAGLKKGSRVLEIGCYDGSLMWEMKSRFGFDVFGCEPCADVADIAIAKYGFNIVKEYFTSRLFEKGSFDMVVFRNVLEHISYPIEFILNVREVLSADGCIILEIPDGEFRVANGILGSVVPEHPNYLGESSLHMILAAGGFSGIECAVYSGGLLAVAKKGKKEKLIKPEKTQIESIFRKLEQGARTSENKHKQISSFMKGLTHISFFGANTCSLELLAMGSVDQKNVDFAIDDDPIKYGREIVNSGIPVKPRIFAESIKGEKTFIVCSYYSHDKLFAYLSNKLIPPYKILRLYPEIDLVKVVR
jgi:SAM-dependent methyltransferase